MLHVQVCTCTVSVHVHMHFRTLQFANTTHALEKRVYIVHVQTLNAYNPAWNACNINALKSCHKRVANDTRTRVSQAQTSHTRTSTALVLSLKRVDCAIQTQTHYTLYLIRTVVFENGPK